MIPSTLPLSMKPAKSAGHKTKGGKYIPHSKHISAEKPEHIKFYNLVTRENEHVHVDKVNAQQLKNKKIVYHATSKNGNGMATIR